MKKRRVFDLDMPEDDGAAAPAGAAPAETFPAGKVEPAPEVKSAVPPRRGPMATAVQENAEALKDPWKNELIYRSPGSDNRPYEIVSLGSDGQEGGDAVPNKDIKSAELSKQLREWRIEQKIERYYEIGNHGICHAIAPEQGHVLPGQTIVCGDSHTTTMGALGTFSSGVGSTDLAAALATGELWFKTPESMLFELNGDLPFGVYSKDIILYIISKIGVDGARYKAMEYRGSGLKSLTMEARFTITNMAVATCCRAAAHLVVSRLVSSGKTASTS